MANKKHWLDKVDSIRHAILALYIAGILLCVEGLRFFVSLFFKPLAMNEIMAFAVPWGLAIIAVIIFIRGFSNNLEN